MTHAGWYKDPSGVGVRFWNGTAWTRQTADSAPPPTPPGWYPDPQAAGRPRWWDGNQWSDAGGVPARQLQPGQNWVTPGFVFAFLFPIVGIIIGIMLLTKERVGAGLAVIGTSFAVAIFAAAYLYTP